MSWWLQIYRRAVYGRPIVIVSGLPRSGTSLMMKMLDAGGLPVWTDNIREADDQNPNGYYELERIKDLDKRLERRWMRHGRGRAVKVISSLLEHLPADNNYRVILMHRDLDEVLASQRAMLARRGDAAGAEHDATLKTAYEVHLRRVRHLLQSGSYFTMLDVGYADVIADPAAAAARVDAFVGGGLDLNRMATAVDPALYRNRALIPAPGPFKG
jgi:hypothetical protein